MKVLLQQKHSRLFLRNPGDWVPSADEARAFANSFEALQFCRHHGLPSSKVVLKFNNSAEDVMIAECP